MSQFGYDVFGWTNQLYNANDKNIKPPTFKEAASGTAIKEDLSAGGRWGEGGKSLTLMDEEHLYLILNPGYEMSLFIKDLETGGETTKTAAGSIPVVQVSGINSVIRMKRYKTPEGDVFDYTTTPSFT